LLVFDRLIATERCLGSIADLFNGEGTFEGTKINKLLGCTDETESIDPQWILRQATDGLAFLHNLKFVHRNLKPTNLLIQIVSEGKYVIKLTDMRRSKYWKADSAISRTGDPVWKLPEICSAESLDPKMDIFVLGCLFHYVLSRGRHPFGSNSDDTTKNLDNPDYDVYQDTWMPELKIEKLDQAVDLMKKMIRYDTDDRCTISQVLKHKYLSPTSDYNLYSHGKLKPGLCLIINQKNFGVRFFRYAFT
jgi:serine/threonine protein kinase